MDAQVGSSGSQQPLLTRLDAALVSRVLSINPRCRRLNLSHNAISRIDDDGCGDDGCGGALLAPLAGLVYLDLSHNALRVVGPAFSALANLQVLDVSRNELCVGVGGASRVAVQV